MTKSIKTLIFATALAALAACSDDVTHGDKFTVGDADNAINLSIGVQSSPTALQSRAALSGHYAMQENTAINLYVEGDWTHSGTTTNIVKKSTYRAVKDDDADNINAIKWKSRDHLYWDDFGTADPDNTANRTKGLGILAVAIDGLSTDPTVLSDDYWKGTSNLPWEVSTDGTNALHKDILVANNLYHATEYTPLKRYTFAEQKGSDPAESRLDFKHVLSRITFILKPGLGFTNFTGPGFWDTPKVYLTRNKTGESNQEWCYTKGTINIISAKATNDGSTLRQVLLDDIYTNSSTGVVTETAIIYPGSDFGNDDNKIVAKIIADYSNVYYITAEKIRAAINATTGHNGEYITKPGYHYIFNVTLNKTDIVVTATITDWNTVTANPVEPKIVVSAEVGNEDDKTKKLTDFRFYRNEGVNVPLFGSSDPVPTAPTTKNVKYTALADAKNPATGSVADGATKWDFYQTGTSTPTQLYWPSHTMHYFFRGVYPKETTIAADAGEGSYIEVTNAAYDASAFPSNLMIGAPEITDGTKCDNPDHTAVDMSKYGICARTGKINLNFRYMMSQVEVDLKTETSSDDKVELNADTKLEILNPITQRNIYLGTRSTGYEASTVRATDYTMHRKGDATASLVTFHDAIVPQYLPKPNEDKPMRFKVTIKNSNGTYDVYYADVQPIQVSESGGAKKTIENWLGGYHYKYTLTLKKTGISVTATITDWIPANGSDNVWM